MNSSSLDWRAGSWAASAPLPAHDTLGRVSDALDDAAAISEAATEEQQRRRADLTARTTALNGVSARLMDATG